MEAGEKQRRAGYPEISYRLNASWFKALYAGTASQEAFLGAASRAGAALARIAAMLLIAGFGEAVGFGCSARASELGPTGSPEFIKATTAACMPPPSGPAYQGWLKSALKYNDALKALRQEEKNIAAAEFDA